MAEAKRKRKGIKRSVSLYAREDSVVIQVAKDKGLDYSSAVRVIINEYVELKLAEHQRSMQLQGSPA